MERPRPDHSDKPNFPFGATRRKTAVLAISILQLKATGPGRAQNQERTDTSPDSYTAVVGATPNEVR